MFFRREVSRLGLTLGVSLSVYLSTLGALSDSVLCLPSLVSRSASLQSLEDDALSSWVLGAHAGPLATRSTPPDAPATTTQL